MRIEGLIRQADAARRLGVSRERVCQIIKAGKLLTEAVAGVVFVTQDSLDHLIAERFKTKAKTKKIVTIDAVIAGRRKRPDMVLEVPDA